ncbi:hypothetical protein M1L60_43725 [Actinoplanes sp. TRM 88003]|uniref:Uncharacterized protein n=1 Tax=Paractinoplanes aksuensis TaxID=2939490 RepID=A0ABT1E5T0_9ACTN|nr:hypothetical protein [Actinoplanes aksuensis]MCO8277510.1 hypothetical protein [Actinoplanes aksuensis]
MSLSTARAIAQQLSDLLIAEGRSAFVWQQLMRQIAADLAVPDATDEERLGSAQERFRSLYRGGRNFSDFYLDRDDEAERIAANQHLDDLVGRLRSQLFTD